MSENSPRPASANESVEIGGPNAQAKIGGMLECFVHSRLSLSERTRSFAERKATHGET